MDGHRTGCDVGGATGVDDEMRVATVPCSATTIKLGVGVRIWGLSQMRFVSLVEVFVVVVLVVERWMVKTGWSWERRGLYWCYALLVKMVAIEQEQWRLVGWGIEFLLKDGEVVRAEQLVW